MSDKAKKCAKKVNAKEAVKKVEFILDAPEAGDVLLAGDFSNWNAGSHPMKKGKKGVWKLKLSLAPGRYEYRFIVDGIWVDDPCCAERVDNGFGTLNCVRVVE